jgi:hypothetical protein
MSDLSSGSCCVRTAAGGFAVCAELSLSEEESAVLKRIRCHLPLLRPLPSFQSLSSLSTMNIDHEISLLVTCIKRIGEAGDDGKTQVTFGKVFKDEVRFLSLFSPQTALSLSSTHITLSLFAHQWKAAERKGERTREKREKERWSTFRQFFFPRVISAKEHSGKEIAFVC